MLINQNIFTKNNKIIGPGRPVGHGAYVLVLSYPIAGSVMSQSGWSRATSWQTIFGIGPDRVMTGQSGRRAFVQPYFTPHICSSNSYVIYNRSDLAHLFIAYLHTH